MGSTKESGSNQESGGGTPQRLGCVQICSLVLHEQDITHSQSSCVRRGGLCVLLLACCRGRSCTTWSVSRDHTVISCTGLHTYVGGLAIPSPGHDPRVSGICPILRVLCWIRSLCACGVWPCVLGCGRRSSFAIALSARTGVPWPLRGPQQP